MGQTNGGINLVLLGRAGAGKSATGNTILGRQAFISKRSPTSVTQDVTVEPGTACGFPVTVYDTPGLSDRDMREKKIQQIHEKVIQKCESGHCVFLLVIKADRFTKEEREAVEKIEELLGEERLKKTWILFTGGDQLEDDNMTIKEFINLSEPLKKLVQKYEQRYHVFTNKMKKRTEQVRMLITKILKPCLNTMVKMKHKVKSQKPNIVKPDTRDSPSSRRIVLLGKSGFGKSAAGNTILGGKEFRSEMNMSSVTSESTVAHGTVSGRSVSVVDTPGFFDTKMKPEELMTEIARSVYISSPGPHAFLIVLRATDRFTDQEQEIPQQIEMMFGEGVLKYSIILFTHGDQLEEKSIEKLIEESSRLRDLVQQCGGRYHVFNNKAQNNREQVNDLLQKIDSMIEQNGRGHYSNQMYEDAQRLRQEEEERRQRGEESTSETLMARISKFISEHPFLFCLAAFALGAVGGGAVGALIGVSLKAAGVVGAGVAVAAGVGAGVGAVGGAVVGAGVGAVGGAGVGAGVAAGVGAVGGAGVGAGVAAGVGAGVGAVGGAVGGAGGAVGAVAYVNKR